MCRARLAAQDEMMMGVVKVKQESNDAKSAAQAQLKDAQQALVHAIASRRSELQALHAQMTQVYFLKSLSYIVRDLIQYIYPGTEFSEFLGSSLKRCSRTRRRWSAVSAWRQALPQRWSHAAIASAAGPPAAHTLSMCAPAAERLSSREPSFLAPMSPHSTRSWRPCWMPSPVLLPRNRLRPCQMQNV